MSMPVTAPDPAARIARFSVFDLDPRTGELRKRGVRVHLQEQPFQILAMLLEHEGDLVTRDELKQRLWSGPVFVDFEQGLNNAIAKIRAALGDSAERPRFVETLERRGYRFIAAVEWVTAGTPRSPAAPGAPARPAAAFVRLVTDGRTIVLTEGGHSVGRDPDASLWIDSAVISRHHARIVVRDGHVTIEDVGSRNGTFVNGERLGTACPLKDGDELRFGTVPFFVRISFGLTGTAPVDDRE
ncbi:MAG: FHA domain-containing protein [Vicinamibacterales bacterium]|nr:FHA domain-containing protein [Vicinamibacterales bacterium]